MNRKRWQTFGAALVAVFAGLALGAPARAQAYKVGLLTSPPPSELAPVIRDVLSGQAVSVSGPQGPLCEIWWRKAIPAQATLDRGLGIAYGQLGQGTLVGAIRFDAVASDYRNQQVKPGVYTLRYVLLPVDGTHMGVAPNRDFLLLVPAVSDAIPKRVPVKIVIDLSRKAAATGHPSVWNLAVPGSAPKALPAVLHQQDDTDVWVLYAQVALQMEDGRSKPLVLALVVAGHSSSA
jgi:hypothetical protein